MAKAKLPQKLHDWVVARQRHHLSHAHVQMARELGLNPNKLGKIDNHRQEPWKAPLPQFIEHLYEKRFGRSRPPVVQSIEEFARAKTDKKAGRASPVPPTPRKATRGAAGHSDLGDLRPMRPLKAHVRNGRLVVDVPTDLPEGAEIYLLPTEALIGDWNDDFDDEDQAALYEALDEGIAQARAEHCVDAEEFVAELLARP